VSFFFTFRGFPFQGDNINISNVNNGKFLGILKLLGHNDEMTTEDLAKVQRSYLEDERMRGEAHYLP
jgi:hypothetical protein